MNRVVSGVLSKRFAIGAGLLGASGLGTLVYSLEKTLEASDHGAHPYPLPWSHNGFTQSLDYNSVRRGYEVYKQVCAACHSMKFIKYRHFVDVFMTEEEAKAEAAEASIRAISETGENITRPGTLSDGLDSPYPNKQAAMAANGGSLPPDLSLMYWLAKGGEDYIFSLLTSYYDAPAGIMVDEGKAYNPYFIGGVIAMPQQLFDEGIEYKDGTPATQSQQAKDVTTFLHWAGEPYHDKRKRYGLKVLAAFPFVAVVLIFCKRQAWAFVKNQKIVNVILKGREKPSPPQPPPPPPPQ